MRRTIKTLGLVGALVVSAFFIAAWKFNASLEPSNNIEDYGNALESVPMALVEQFPKTVPEGIKSRFYYRPGFLQGGTTVELILGSSTESIKESRARYEAKAVEHWLGCPRDESSAELMPRLKRPSAGANLACSFDVYILQVSPPEEWNHGHESGIAFSEKRNEVLYWVKVW